MVINNDASLDVSQIEDMRESTAAGLADIPEEPEEPANQDEPEPEQES